MAREAGRMKADLDVKSVRWSDVCVGVDGRGGKGYMTIEEKVIGRSFWVCLGWERLPDALSLKIGELRSGCR